ncbi:amidohydrolase family protein [Gammaproteobacteria bacterium AS21]|jgi:predicted TIM-barrel fold metal-dependent hydrolase
MKIIDPHLHLFDLEQGEYHWLNDNNPPFWPDKHKIAKNFNAQDLTLPPSMSLQGIIHIEAGFDNQRPWREIDWLESNYQTSLAYPVRTIAAIDLTLPCDTFDVLISDLCKYKSVVGFRHILDRQAQHILSLEQVQKNLIKIADHAKIFECQLALTDTPAVNLLLDILDKAANLKVIISHAGCVVINDENHLTWYHNMQALAAFDQVVIKASGWEMIDRDYKASYVQHAVECLIDLFSINRVMLASNFPLCLFSCSYADLWHSYAELDFSAQQKKKLLYLNAKKHYQL